MQVRSQGFGVAFAAVAAGLVAAFWIGGIRAESTVAMPAVLEVALSFDNATVNATVLRRLNVL